MVANGCGFKTGGVAELIEGNCCSGCRRSSKHSDARASTDFTAITGADDGFAAC